MLREASGKYFLWEEKFNSLNELVSFYHTTTIAKKRQVFLRDEESLRKVGGQRGNDTCWGPARGLASLPSRQPHVMGGGVQPGSGSSILMALQWNRQGWEGGEEREGRSRLEIPWSKPCVAHS